MEGKEIYIKSLEYINTLNRANAIINTSMIPHLLYLMFSLTKYDI